MYNVQTEETANSSSEECVLSVSYGITKMPLVSASILDTEIKFLVDTGASVNIVSSDIHERMQCKPELSPIIYAYGAQVPLAVKGNFCADIKYKSHVTEETFYVVDSTKGKYT